MSPCRFGDCHLGGSVDEQIWMVALHNRPEAETSHPLTSFLDDQRLRTVVGHVEPNALVLTDLGNLQRVWRSLYLCKCQWTVEI